jgi:hypothetical protein
MLVGIEARRLLLLATQLNYNRRTSDMMVKGLAPRPLSYDWNQSTSFLLASALAAAPPPPSDPPE